MRIHVIGAGPAGCMAAIRAAENGHDVVIIEKNAKIGRKLYISGKGRCNLTNSADYRTFLQNVVSNPKFPMSALRAFSNEDAENFFTNAGVPLKTERGGRVFPVSDKASDIIDALHRKLRSLRIGVVFSAELLSLNTSEGKITSVITSGGEFFTDHVIMATGGASYPLTGSDGKGYGILSALGHRVVPPVPALSASVLDGVYDRGGKLIGSDTLPFPEGLSLRNVRLNAVSKGKTVRSEFGEMLFTSSGVSGPIALTVSSYVNRLDSSDLVYVIDLKPALDEQTLDKRICGEFSSSNKAFRNALAEFLPHSLIPYFCAVCGINGAKQVNLITREERKRIVSALKNMTFRFRSLAPLEEAIVTAGGIDVKEIDPRTMRSKIIPNLSVCGELLDVDALTGGFNIQLALSTGYAAGNGVGNL